MTIEVVEQITGLRVHPLLVRPRDLVERFAAIFGEVGADSREDSGVEFIQDDEEDVERLDVEDQVYGKRGFGTALAGQFHRSASPSSALFCHLVCHLS